MLSVLAYAKRSHLASQGTELLVMTGIAVQAGPDSRAVKVPFKFLASSSQCG
jgi:hypothetical protein